MSEQIIVLSERQLVDRIDDLIRLRAAFPGLEKAAADAVANREDNWKQQQKISSELGAHTRNTRQPEVILTQGLSAVIPVPSPMQSWTDSRVDIKFFQPKGKL